MHPRARTWQAVVVVGSAAVACAVLVGVTGGLGGAPAPAPTAEQAPAPAAPTTFPESAGAFRLDAASGAAPAAAQVAPATKAPTASVPAVKPAVKPAAKPAVKPAVGSAGKPAGRSVPAPAATGSTDTVDGTPCTAAARACVDLDDREAWLIDDGEVVRGPVEIMHGDEEDPTPTGTFHVQWKAEQYTSREYLTQMPYSVFFADGGVAFHEGNQETPSAGCVKLEEDDAMAFFAFLQVGDEVQVH